MRTPNLQYASIILTKVSLLGIYPKDVIMAHCKNSFSTRIIITESPKQD